MNSIRISVLCLAALLGAVACRRGDKSNVPVQLSRSPDAASAPTPEQPGDVRIVASDGGVDLALLGDTISSGLSQQALAKVRRETDTAAVKGNGFGASIEKMVKGTVSGAIGTRVAFPISSISDARYDNGKIVFEGDGHVENVFKDTNVNGKKLLESFSPADAQRFVDAVNARKKAQAPAK